ncbi:MAG: Gfo/Idh/MocA family oxidoreductase, partial [Myxococcales bacterium]|nr:Gfo/Idh/MocA family oxidoreductase [Myxococcales bacterium]
MAAKLRIAVAGAGQIGKRHIEMIGRNEGCVLSAIVDPGPAAADYAASLDVPLFRSLDELLERDTPD